MKVNPITVAFCPHFNTKVAVKNTMDSKWFCFPIPLNINSFLWFYFAAYLVCLLSRCWATISLLSTKTLWSLKFLFNFFFLFEKQSIGSRERQLFFLSLVHSPTSGSAQHWSQEPGPPTWPATRWQEHKDLVLLLLLPGCASARNWTQQSSSPDTDVGDPCAGQHLHKWGKGSHSLLTCPKYLCVFSLSWIISQLNFLFT